MRKGKPLVGDAAAPPAATAAFERVLEAIAEGGGAAVVPLDAELTTRQAAEAEAAYYAGTENQAVAV
jgi:hypothetical protein